MTHPRSQPGSRELRHFDALLPMDIACLGYLVEHGECGSMPTIAISIKLFQGEIPAGTPNLVDLGLIRHAGDKTKITAAGRLALAESQP